MRARSERQCVNTDCIRSVAASSCLCYEVSRSGSTGFLHAPGLLVTRMDKSKDVFDVSVDDAFDFLSQEYAELFNGLSATAFQHPMWLDSLYSKLAPAAAAKRLVVVVRYRATGALAMVLPLLRIRRGPIRTVEFADLRVSDYLAPVCAAQVFSDLLQDEDACLKIRRLIGPFDLLRMPKLPDGRIPIETLLAAPRRISMDTNAYSTLLIAPYEQWRANALDRSYQKELAKKWRQLQKKGAPHFSCCDDGASTIAAMEVMKNFRGPRFQAQGDGDLLQRSEYFDFYSDVATRGLGSFVRLYTMKMDDNVIAAVLGLCHRGSFLIIMSPRLHHRRRALQAAVWRAAFADVERDASRQRSRFRRLVRAEASALDQAGRQENGRIQATAGPYLNRHALTGPPDRSRRHSTVRRGARRGRARSTPAGSGPPGA